MIISAHTPKHEYDCMYPIPISLFQKDLPISAQKSSEPNTIPSCLKSDSFSSSSARRQVSLKLSIPTAVSTNDTSRNLCVPGLPRKADSSLPANYNRGYIGIIMDTCMNVLHRKINLDNEVSYPITSSFYGYFSRCGEYFSHIIFVGDFYWFY